MRILLLIGFLLSVQGCKHSPSDHLYTTENPHLAQEEVLRIAERAAIKHGERLNDFERPKVQFAANRWIVLYFSKPPTVGGNFAIWIDDETGKAEFQYQD